MRTKHSLSPYQKGQGKYTKLRHFLQAAPYLTLSPTALTSIAKRFSINPEKLTQAVERQRKGGHHNG